MNLHQSNPTTTQQQASIPTSHKQPHQWLTSIQTLFKPTPIQSHLINQIHQILPRIQSVIIIYQKLFIKFKTSPQPNQTNHYMLKITRSFPLNNSVRLYLLDGPYQPKISDTRNLMRQLLGKDWNFEISLKQILQKISKLENKLSTINQNYLALQNIGDFLLGDVFIYNQLQQHTSLNLFIDKTQPTTNILTAISQTHLLIFQKVIKKSYKSKEEEDYQMKSKTLYGKKFILSKFCHLQCISSMYVGVEGKDVTLNIVKYRSLRLLDEAEHTTRKITFSDDQSMKQFIRIILKNLPKYQPTKITFLPSYDKAKPQPKQKQKQKQQLSIQKVLQLNELQQRLQSRSINNSRPSSSLVDLSKHQQLINRLNKSYQKMIQYYSARANPYYLIYVSKLNNLYLKYFVEGERQGNQKQSLHRHNSIGDNNLLIKDSQFGQEKNQSSKTKNKLIKSLTLDF